MQGLSGVFRSGDAAFHQIAKAVTEQVIDAAVDEPSQQNEKERTKAKITSVIFPEGNSADNRRQNIDNENDG